MDSISPIPFELRFDLNVNKTLPPPVKTEQFSFYDNQIAIKFKNWIAPNTLNKRIQEFMAFHGCWKEPGISSGPLCLSNVQFMVYLEVDNCNADTFAIVLSDLRFLCDQINFDAQSHVIQLGLKPTLGYMGTKIKQYIVKKQQRLHTTPNGKDIQLPAPNAPKRKTKKRDMPKMDEVRKELFTCKGNEACCSTDKCPEKIVTVLEPVPLEIKPEPLPIESLEINPEPFFIGNTAVIGNVIKTD